MRKIKFKLYNWFISILPPCDVIIHQLSDSKFSKFGILDRIKLKLHLKSCIWCTRYGQQADFIDAAFKQRLKQAESDLVDASLSVESKKRMKQLIQNSQQ